MPYNQKKSKWFFYCDDVRWGVKTDNRPAERQARLLAEEEAKRISDLIDEELNRQRAAERKGPPPVKILLLGELFILYNW